MCLYFWRLVCQKLKTFLICLLYAWTVRQCHAHIGMCFPCDLLSYSYIWNTVFTFFLLRHCLKCSTVHVRYAGVGQQTLFRSPQIPNPKVLVLNPLPQFRKFLSCASPQNSNPQIYTIVDYTLSQNGPESRLLKWFFILYKYNSEQYMLYSLR